MRQVEYINPNSYAVQLAGPNRELTTVGPRKKIILSEWYIGRYTPKLLKVVRVLSADTGDLPPKRVRRRGPHFIPSPPRAATRQTSNKKIAKVSTRISGNRKKRRKVSSNLVGRAVANKTQANDFFKSILPQLELTISNNVGIGILSYNRLSSIKRLLKSIRKYTDLNRVTVFVSDESSDNETRKWLNKQKDIIVLCKERRGIAANSNRLLRCLERFQYKFILNDDIEVLQDGWCDLYIEAAQKTKYHHFCLHQPGVYGAKDDAAVCTLNGVDVETIYDKPQGGLMFLTHKAFKQVGFFDTKFGIYGMEHVDYSHRVSLSCIQPKGYHDVAGATELIKLHSTASAVGDRITLLSEARKYFEKVKDQHKRIYIGHNDEKLPTLTYIIPCRGGNRSGAVHTVVNCIRAQKFPVINIILVEQDSAKRIDIEGLNPIEYMFVKSTSTGKRAPFNKAEAFNVGVKHCKTDFMVLHDADILTAPTYSKAIHASLLSFDSCHLGSTVVYMSGTATNRIVTGKGIEDVGESNRVVGYFEGGSLGCRKKAYKTVGGFNEDFYGYGIEDCDFYNRVLNHTNFRNNRVYNFIHLEHDRSPGWQDCHERNKNLGRRISKTMTPHNYIESLRKRWIRKYG